MTDISRLVLTRKVYQSIHIGDLITVTVEEVRGRTVRLSVEAPRGIAVHRREIYERYPRGAGRGRRRPRRGRGRPAGVGTRPW